MSGRVACERKVTCDRKVTYERKVTYGRKVTCFVGGPAWQCVSGSLRGAETWQLLGGYLDIVERLVSSDIHEQ